MDISYKIENERFNYRVCAIIINENKLLTMYDTDASYYYLPGGRVQLHETAEKAILRELNEELEIEAQIIRPLWINQSFFVEKVKNEKYHELCIYFYIDISNTKVLKRGEYFEIKEKNKIQKFHWLDIFSLKKYNIYPKFIKENIIKLPEHIVLQCEYEY